MTGGALRRSMAALLLPLVVLVGVASTNQLLLCRMDGYQRSCCCPHEQARVASETALQRPSCCAAVDARVAPAPSVEQRQTHTVAKLAAAYLAVDSSAAPTARAALALAPAPRPRANVPRATVGPPLFILHRALLI